MGIFRDLSQWFTNPNPATPPLGERMKQKAQERREARILKLARQLWEEDGKLWNRFEGVENYYKSKAIEKLESQKLHHYFLRPLISLERQLEKLLAFLKTLAFLEILGITGNITILIALFSFMGTERQRRNAEVYQAWQVITAANGQTGSGGRIEALEFLNSEPRRFPFFWLKWKRQSLAGLAAPEAYLKGVKLPSAKLLGAELQGAKLLRANLQDADLRGANLQEAKLSNVNFQNSQLSSANLQDTYLLGANLQNAYLLGAQLRDAYLFEANLQDSKLSNANLQNANLSRANLQDADLRYTTLQDADLRYANLQDAHLENVNNINAKQIKLACFWEKAIYKFGYNEERKDWIVIEPDNTKFIEELKKDKSSDPKYPPDCSFWDKP